jgi:hypothetical protein
MAGRRSSRRASVRFVAPRLATCIVLVAGAALVSANPAAALGPSAPTITRLTPGPAVAAMSLRWSAPSDAGSAPITAYEYRVQVDSGPFGPPSPLGTAADRRAVAPCIAPAAAGHGCTYEVRATNGTPGDWSIPVGATWLPPSNAILGRSAGGPAANTATLMWRVPKTSGGLEIGYQYMVDAGSGFAGPFTIDPNTITALPTIRYVVLSAPVPCVPTGPVLGCSYVLTAVNDAGASAPSKTRTAYFRHPSAPTGLQVYTSSVALLTGVATQAVSWVAPENVGGSAITDYVVEACSTTGGSLCTNTAPGWLQVADVTGNPPPTETMHGCPANGRCAYEVWAKNPLGKGWVFGYAGSGGPTNLTGTTSPSHVTLQWLNPVDPGTFGNYVLFECDNNQQCGNGNWTNVLGDAAPWNRVDLVGTATTATYVCPSNRVCTFRIGYIDADGNIGGVSNSIALSGH